VASTDPRDAGYSYRRSSSVVGGVRGSRGGRPGGGGDVRLREGVLLGASLTPSAFAESVLCYVGDAAGQSVRRGEDNGGLREARVVHGLG